jgi:hypothetical protein
MSVTSTSRTRPRTRLITRPRTSALVGLGAFLAAVAVVVVAIIGVDTIANSKAGEIVTRQTTVPGSTVNVLPDTPGALLVQRDREGAVVGLTAFALNPGGSGGTVIVIPASTVIPQPDGQMMRVGDAFIDGGLVGQQQAVEGLLGVSFATAADVDQAGLATLLAPYAPMSVTFTDRVVDTVDGEDDQLYASGNPDLTAEDAARVLLARKSGESELARIDRTVAVWEAVLGEPPSDTGAAGTAGASTTAVPPNSTIDAFLAGVANGPHGVQNLEVEVLPDVEGNELFEVESPEYVHLLMAQIMPSAVSTAEGARVRLLQPRPDQDGLLVATARLDALGMNLVLATSGGDEALPELTKIEYYAPEDKAAADQLAQSGAFGPTPEVVQAVEQFDGINLTVTLGADFAAIVETEKQAAADAGATTTLGPPGTDEGGGDEEDG